MIKDKGYNDKGYILEVDLKYPKRLIIKDIIFIMIYHSYQKEWKFINT